MEKNIKIGNKIISETSPVYIVAEMSGNHNMDLIVQRRSYIDQSALEQMP